jgi:hypothetical protein
VRDVQSTIFSAFLPHLYGICHITMTQFDSVAIVPLAHRGTVNVVLLAHIGQSAADVFSIVFCVFSQSWVSIFAFIIYIVPIK